MLHAFGFKEILSWITFNAPVPDSQVYSCNLEWLNGLSAEVRESVEFASDVTFQKYLAQVPAFRAFAMAEMAKAGVRFYVPTADEIGAWAVAGSPQRLEWDNYKKDLAGSLSTFNRLLDAANTPDSDRVHDIRRSRSRRVG